MNRIWDWRQKVYCNNYFDHSILTFIFSEIYRIVSQKQITDGSSDGDKPGVSQTINLQPTVPDTKDKKACCN